MFICIGYCCNPHLLKIYTQVGHYPILYIILYRLQILSLDCKQGWSDTHNIISAATNQNWKDKRVKENQETSSLISYTTPQNS